MMKYDVGRGEFKDWIVAEVQFSTKHLGKAESIMVLGNGYLGLRSATEEPYLGETRDLFVAGTFNKFNEDEVTELPNAADVTRLDIAVDGERFSLEFGTTTEYVRQLNLKTGELVRSFIWTSPKGKAIRFVFRRFVSLADLHVIGMRVEVTPLQHNIGIQVDSGIDIRMTNSGSQHFSDGERRIFDRTFIQQVQTTNESKIDFVISTVNAISVDGIALPAQGVMEMDRRKVWMRYDLPVPAEQTLVLEKITTVWTSRDLDAPAGDLDGLKQHALDDLRGAAARGYDALRDESALAWKDRVWDRYDLEIESTNDFDLLAARFAVYHMVAMTPAHDERMSVAAKGRAAKGTRGTPFGTRSSSCSRSTSTAIRRSPVRF